MKEYLKGTKYGTKDFEKGENFDMEYGDVLYALLSLATETGINADKCLDLALEKYRARIAKNKAMGGDGH